MNYTVTWFYRCQHIAGQWTIDKDSRLQEFTSRSFVKLCCVKCRKAATMGHHEQRQTR